MKFSELIDLNYIINFALFGVDRSQDCTGSGEQSNIKDLSLLEKSSATLPCAATHAVICLAYIKCRDMGNIGER